MPEFRVDLNGRGRADVYLACDVWDENTARLVKQLDDAEIRVVGDIGGWPPGEDRVRRIVQRCSGLICTSRQADSLLRFSNLPDMPVLEIPGNGLLSTGMSLTGLAVGAFIAAVLQSPPGIREYAFYIGRLERDFSHAREALRSAIENEVGIPLLWVDDGRHRANVEGIRDRTRLLLQHASFVVADLTLGIESPDRENPSRAHEIGLSMAYNRSLLLLSQEPRRYTYFSINDRQTIFWATEDDLHQKVCEWAISVRDLMGRTTFNYRLAVDGTHPNIAPLQFYYTPGRRFIGPRTPGTTRSRHFAGLVATAVVFLAALWILLTKGSN